MQNRLLLLVSLLTLLVSYYAYSLSSNVYNEAEKYAQKFENQVIQNSVGLSLSPVGLQAREGQDFLTERAKGGGEKQDSQGGKQESLSKASPIGGVAAEYNEAVAEPVQNNAPAKPVRRSTEIYKWVDDNGTVHFSDQRKGELVELEDSVSSVDTKTRRSATR